jgi:integrase
MEDIKYIISKLPYIDFRPAKVKETNGDEWRIVFYVRKPGKNEMFRFRRRVQKIPGKRNRMRLAKRICADINKKLEGGWSPFIEGSGKDEYRRLYDVMGMFLDQCERRMRDSQFRPDSLRAYTSYVKNIKDYIELKGITEMFTAEFNKKFIIGFLDYIYFEKKRSARTSNNYLGFCNVLASFMYDREYITTNPIYGIKKRKNSKKKREVIPKIERKAVFEYQRNQNKNYLTLCLTVYFCFIRRTEISKLLVKHVNLVKDTIFIPGGISKNTKDGIVTIPKKLKELLLIHLDGSAQEDFLFSDDNFKPGKKKLAPKRISDTWSKMRKTLKFKQEYQFYSLKDTGITELFLLNVPIIKIRDQARHHDIKITEAYTPRNYVCDDTIKNLDFDF